jgi:MtN3 and saliva related transmembrane protein
VDLESVEMSLKGSNDMLGEQSIQIVGAGAALASTISFLPQAWKIISTRDVEGLSRRMYMLTVIGFGLWLIYGIGKGDWALIVPNAICLTLTIFILAMIMLPKQKRDALADAVEPKSDTAK